MVTIPVWTFHQNDLEDYLDDCKATIMQSLVNEEMIEQSKAERWCETHTIILRRTSLFQSFIKRFLRKDEGGHYMIIVKAA